MSVIKKKNQKIWIFLLFFKYFFKCRNVKFLKSIFKKPKTVIFLKNMFPKILDFLNLFFQSTNERGLLKKYFFKGPSNVDF